VVEGPIYKRAMRSASIRSGLMVSFLASPRHGCPDWSKFTATLVRLEPMSAGRRFVRRGVFDARCTPRWNAVCGEAPFAESSHTRGRPAGQGVASATVEGVALLVILTRMLQHGAGALTKRGRRKTRVDNDCDTTSPTDMICDVR
jgi:hypothetical protein